MSDRDLVAEFERTWRENEAAKKRAYAAEFPLPFSIAWLAESLIGPRVWEVQDALFRAWDDLRNDELWGAWYTAHEPSLSPPENFDYLQVDDRRTRLFRRRANGLSLFVPIREIDEAHDMRQFMASLISDFVARAASETGVEPPPSRPG